MQTVTLGHTGEQVSRLCLGAMYFGTRNDRATSYDILDRYLAAGGTFIDTANIYAHWVDGYQGGESETLLGEWLRERGNRDQIFLATKVGFEYPGVPRGLPHDRILAECDKSLQRLGVDTIDLYYAHTDDYSTPTDDILSAFDKLVQAGKVRYIGASNYLAWRLEEARWTSQTNGWPAYCCVQQRFTYLRPTPGASTAPQVVVNDDLIDYVRRRDMPLVAYSVLLSGAYTRDDRPVPDEYAGPDTNSRLATLREVANEVGATVNQVVLAWMLHSNFTVIPLIAASSDAQLQENLGALAVELSDYQMLQLNSAMG